MRASGRSCYLPRPPPRELPRAPPVAPPRELPPYPPPIDGALPALREPPIDGALPALRVEAPPYEGVPMPVRFCAEPVLRPPVKPEGRLPEGRLSEVPPWTVVRVELG